MYALDELFGITQRAKLTCAERFNLHLIPV